MSEASRARQRDRLDKAAAAALTQRAGQCTMYRNEARPGVYRIAGTAYRMDDRGTLRKVEPDASQARGRANDSPSGKER